MDRGTYAGEDGVARALLRRDDVAACLARILVVDTLYKAGDRLRRRSVTSGEGTWGRPTGREQIRGRSYSEDHR